MKLRNIMILVLMIMLIMSGCSNNEQPDSSASGNNSVETVSDLEALQDGIEWLEDGLIGPADEPEIVSGDISHIEEANSTLYKAGESKCHEYTEKALENELAAIEYDISDNDIDIADLDAAVYNLAVKNVYLNIQYYSDVMEAAIIKAKVAMCCLIFISLYLVGKCYMSPVVYFLTLFLYILASRSGESLIQLFVSVSVHVGLLSYISLLCRG